MSPPKPQAGQPAGGSKLTEYAQVAEFVNSQFRPERILANSILGIALTLMLTLAGMAALRHDWQEVNTMLLGSGGVGSVGFTGFFYMYNRNLKFILQLAGKGNAEEKDNHDKSPDN
jgi:hypothetical protein